MVDSLFLLCSLCYQIVGFFSLGERYKNYSQIWWMEKIREREMAYPVLIDHDQHRMHIMKTANCSDLKTTTHSCFKTTSYS